MSADPWDWHRYIRELLADTPVWTPGFCEPITLATQWVAAPDPAPPDV